MTNRQVASVVRKAEALGLEDLDRARYILDAGVSLDDYRRYERARTLRVVAICLTAVACVLGACDWAARRWGAGTEAKATGRME